MDRAAKTAARAVKRGEVDQARIVFDLAASRIEIILGEGGTPPASAKNPWDDE